MDGIVCFNCGRAVLTPSGSFIRCSHLGDVAPANGCDSIKLGKPQRMSESEHFQATVKRQDNYWKRRMNRSDDL